jgi:hypothetical protein
VPTTPNTATPAASSTSSALAEPAVHLPRSLPWSTLAP